MLFRNIISFFHTKKLFQRSILESFKSFVSGGYTKLPKSPPCHCTLNPFSCTRASNSKFRHSYRELDNFYAEYANQWHHPDKEDQVMAANERNMSNHTVPSSMPTSTIIKQENEDCVSRNVIRVHQEKTKNRIRHQGKSGKGKEIGDQLREERIRLVTEKLKELEIMDGSNVEHVLDIEEVIHYYSRLTCPAYLGIIDKFFMEMCTELSNLQAPADSGRVNVSRPRRRMRIN